jgi:Adenosine-deaminase (editase) domain
MPISCSLRGIGQGTILTCSDKIGFWQIFGLQNKLVSGLIPEPIKLSSIIVGRKFNLETCQRAICCRFQDFRTQKMKEGKVDKKYEI